MKLEVKEWIEKAEEDWSAAKRLGRGRRPLFNLVCFHAQQCAEKYIKAFLLQLGRPIPRVHDLAELVKLAEPELNFLVLRRDDLEALTGYAVSSRYPGEEATAEQAKTAREIASEIREIIRAKLQLRD